MLGAYRLPCWLQIWRTRTIMHCFTMYILNNFFFFLWVAFCDCSLVICCRHGRSRDISGGHQHRLIFEQKPKNVCMRIPCYYTVHHCFYNTTNILECTEHWYTPSTVSTVLYQNCFHSEYQQISHCFFFPQDVRLSKSINTVPTFRLILSYIKFRHLGTGLCNPDPCVHGTCLSSEVEYLCLCDAGYTGQNCETGKYKKISYIIVKNPIVIKAYWSTFKPHKIARFVSALIPPLCHNAKSKT